MLYQSLKADTQGFQLSGHSSNFIKNWPFQVKLYLPYPKFCASFWKPTSNINHWISTLLPVVWTSTLIFMMPQMFIYSDQVKNRGALSGMQMTPGSCSITWTVGSRDCGIMLYKLWIVPSSGSYFYCFFIVVAKNSCFILMQCNAVLHETRWAGQSPTWGRPAPQFRVQNQFK